MLDVEHFSEMWNTLIGQHPELTADSDKKKIICDRNSCCLSDKAILFVKL